jgi:DNA polymerase
MEEKSKNLEQIKKEVVSLEQSPLFAYRKTNGYVPVIGEGNHDTQVVFIGEAPGKNEALTGKPFCGAAGRILDELLLSISLERADIYITNIVKDRPPDNRDPTKKEIDLYTPFLERQLDIIQPAIIAPLGRFSMTYILEKFGCPEKINPIGKNHGKIIQAKASYGPITILPLYHPAVALYNGRTKQTLKDDMHVLRSLLH